MFRESKEEQKEFNEVYEIVKEEEFNSFVNLKFNEIETEEDIIKFSSISAFSPHYLLKLMEISIQIVFLFN